MSCHSVCPCGKEAMLVFRVLTCSRSWERIVFICFFARYVSLSMMVSIWNLVWRNILLIRSISLVPFIKRKTLFWNFWSFCIWHFLLLIEGNGAYSIVGLMILLYRVLFTCSSSKYLSFSFFRVHYHNRDIFWKSNPYGLCDDHKGIDVQYILLKKTSSRR